MPSIARIGILTGGGDAPGLNAVIRAVVKCAVNSGIECVGIEQGFDGLADPDAAHTRPLTPREVTGILRIGGTILGASSRGNPFGVTGDGASAREEYASRVIGALRRLSLDGLVAVGGDGTLAIAHEFSRRGIPIVGVPKTIDNDVVGTTNTCGFDTAVAFATDAIDRLHTTAEAHRRIIVVEVMGRYSGWIALHSGIAGGGDAILIPEIPFDLSVVADRLVERDRWGAHFSIVVVAEGAYPTGGGRSIVESAHEGRSERLGGIGSYVASALGTLTRKETRTVSLGHLQRGGAPTRFDRLLATRFGAKAVELLTAGEFGAMVGFAPPEIVSRPLAEIVGRIKSVPTDSDLLATATALGVTFGAAVPALAQAHGS